MDSGTNLFVRVFKMSFPQASLLECGVWFGDAAGMRPVASCGGDRSCRVP